MLMAAGMNGIRARYVEDYAKARVSHRSPQKAAARWQVWYAGYARYWPRPRRAALSNYIHSGDEFSGWINTDRRAKWSARRSFVRIRSVWVAEIKGEWSMTPR